MICSACKESTAPAAPEGTTRKCEPTGDGATKCTYVCMNDESVKTETSCNAETGKWDPTDIAIVCPCGDPPSAPDGVEVSPEVKKPVPAETVITYKCPIDGRTKTTKCEKTGKYSSEKIDLPCKGNQTKMRFSVVI